MGRMTTTPQRRGFHLTPDRIVLVLLVWDGFLLVAERFYWLPKGWAPLIALATAAAALLLVLLCFAAGLLLRRRPPLSLRALLALTLAVAVPCGWLVVEIRQTTAQRDVVAAIKKQGGAVYCRTADFSPPAWLGRLTGDLFFEEVDQVGPPRGVTDAGLEDLQGFHRLRGLWLDGAKVTDAGLAKLGGFGELEELLLNDTPVADAGLHNLRGLTQLQSLGLDNSPGDRRRAGGPQGV